MSYLSAFMNKLQTSREKSLEKGRELSNDVEQIAWKLFEAGKTIDYVSHTLHLLRSSVGSCK